MKEKTSLIIFAHWFVSGFKYDFQTAEAHHLQTNIFIVNGDVISEPFYLVHRFTGPTTMTFHFTNFSPTHKYTWLSLNNYVTTRQTWWTGETFRNRGVWGWASVCARVGRMPWHWRCGWRSVWLLDMASKGAGWRMDDEWDGYNVHDKRGAP